MRMLRFICSALIFTSLIPLSAIGKEVTVEPGETLSEIADRNNVSVNVLKQLNGITNPNNIKAGEKLNLPQALTLETNKTRHIHTVMNGETLSEIAMKYKIDQQEIINFNNIKSANHIYPGQNLRLPKIKKTDLKKRSISHKVSRGETLSSIAKSYKIPLRDLISINSIKDPNDLALGTKLALVSNTNQGPKIINSQTEELAKSLKNRKYGPLFIDWSNWKIMDGSHVAPILHDNGKSLYLAINCPFRKINATGEDGQWKEWIAPIDNFEHNLIKDRCN